MNGNFRKTAAFLLATSLVCLIISADSSWAQTETSASASENKVIAEADCTAAKLGSAIPVSAIGEPVSGVALNAPEWTASKSSSPAYCSVSGSMAPVDKAANAKPINFRVVMPASWSGRAAQMESFKVLCPNCQSPLRFCEGCQKCEACGHSQC